MTYAMQSSLGDLPAGWAQWPLPARVTNIRVRAAGVRALANAMGVEMRRVNPSFQVEDYDSVLSVLQGMARGAVQASVPVQIVQNAVLYGLAQMDRLAVAALAAVDALQKDGGKFNTVANSAANIERLRLAAQALDLAEQIQGLLLRIFRVLHPQAGTSGFGDVEGAAYALGIGLLFGLATGGATVPIGILVALYQLFKDADGIVGAIANAIGKAVDAVVAAAGQFAKDVAAGAGRAVGNWLTVMLIGGTVAAGLYFGVPYLMKRAASRA